MATQTIENFNTLDLETLASVEGGVCIKTIMVKKKQSIQIVHSLLRQLCS